ncbi:sigma-70 family RNA polymerase sigma factor [Lujinxingia sediminis]|uniref:Sigma-70 family RNA polymerase sigma factor n=1 Tax=Lujinxingia sediminis TaxID=2480984 RepID=A0ABY0CSK7_9DELT|nr:sigma-70 family RNA polymerase sigma factor [Lujinxingia sediminis]RVU44108.1 sigma-70 family RNA polymerase sigma factor [Lujinxingia sediminis]
MTDPLPANALDVLDDAALASRAVDGDFAAFEKIVERHRDKAYRLALSLTKSEADAQDVVQEAFINIYRKLDTFAGDAQLSSWMYRIVVNAALMRLRKTRRRAEVSVDDVSDPAHFEQSAPGEPAGWRVRGDEAAENRELREQILAAIDQLEPKYQAAFLLREIEGLSLDEIASVLDLSTGAVKTRLHRARLFLQAALEPYLGREEDISN